MSNVISGHAEFVNNDTNVTFKSDAFKLSTVKVPKRDNPPRSINYTMSYGFDLGVNIKYSVN